MSVVRSLEAEGAVFVEELDDVPPGSVVIFSAHGVSPVVGREASDRRLLAYDAVCPLVAKVHLEVVRHTLGGRVVILVGHEGHPEIEGTLGHVRGGRSFVVNSTSDVASLPISGSTPAAYAVQTTYSVSEAHEIVEALRAKFSDLVGPSSSDICYATTNRQNAIRVVAERADAVIVVGEAFSSNARRLVEVARPHCPRVQLVPTAAAIDWSLIGNAEVIGISAAASTPDDCVQGVIKALGQRYDLTVDEIDTVTESAAFKPVQIA
jgi:4-hydroxy-3-methylbut-2-enyl diphosphate reductase